MTRKINKTLTMISVKFHTWSQNESNVNDYRYKYYIKNGNP